MVRTRIAVQRPPTDRYAESWEVLVTEVKRPWGKSFEVLGTLQAIHVPEQYDLDQQCWIPAHDRVIPGVVVPASGPEPHKTLGQAREKARRLADVLDGRLFPVWKEVSA